MKYLKIFILSTILALYACGQAIDADTNKEPHIAIDKVSLLDSANNKVAEINPGDNIYLKISAVNIGEIDGLNVKVRAYSDDPNIDISSASASHAYNMVSNHIIDFTERYLIAVDPGIAINHNSTIYFEFSNDSGIINTQQFTINIGMPYKDLIYITDTTLPDYINATHQVMFNAVIKSDASRRIKISDIKFLSSDAAFVGSGGVSYIDAGKSVTLNDLAVTVPNTVAPGTVVTLKILITDTSFNNYLCLLKFTVKPAIPQIKIEVGRFYEKFSGEEILFKNNLTNFNLKMINVGAIPANNLKVNIIGSGIADLNPSANININPGQTVDTEGNLSTSPNYMKGDGRFTIFTSSSYATLAVSVTDDDGNFWTTSIQIEAVEQSETYIVTSITYGNDGILNPGESTKMQVGLKLSSNFLATGTMTGVSTTPGITISGSSDSFINRSLNIRVDNTVIPGLYPATILVQRKQNVWRIPITLKVE